MTDVIWLSWEWGTRGGLTAVTPPLPFSTIMEAYWYWRPEPVTDPNDKTRLISLPEAAELYGFSPDYLRNLAQKGRLQAQKVGPVWVTTPQSMETYIDSRKKRGTFRDDIYTSDWQEFADEL